jgi:hypothetical protein
MKSILCSWFEDWGLAIRNALGTTWLVVFICAFAFISCLLLQSILRASINKTKFVFKWGQLICLIILVLFIIWFCTLL